jgi:O-antigen biosynthesis protein
MIHRSRKRRIVHGTGFGKIWPSKDTVLKEYQLQKYETRKALTNSIGITIVTPVYNVPIQWFRMCVNSVLNQSHTNWEWVLVDDCSTSYPLLRLLSDLPKNEKIKVIHMPQNSGIVKATNAGIQKASLEYVSFLDDDDELRVNALEEVASAILDHSPDMIYSDEDKVGTGGEHYDFFYKPDWSPNLILSMMYTGHFMTVKRETLNSLGNLRPEYNGSQDWDLVLRLATHNKSIYHIPKVLYHWKAIPSSTAAVAGGKKYATDSQVKALQDYIATNNLNAEVQTIIGEGFGRYRIKYKIEKYDPVTILIPTGGRLDLLKTCLDSIYTKTTYPSFNIVIIDNSCTPKTKEFITSRYGTKKNITVYQNNTKPFNYSALCNFGVEKVRDPYLILLNDDIEVKTNDWICSLLEYAQKDKVGIVGCKLLYRNETIQHAGVMFGPYDHTGHAFKHLPNDKRPYFDFPHVVRDVSAVTFACAMMKTEFYKSMKGLDERRYPIAFNDVDFCIRSLKIGKQIIYTPHAILYHLESVSKPNTIGPGETERSKVDCKHLIEHDPFYNPNLTRRKEDWSYEP